MLTALGAALLGFLLGLKHATDADHVVAITTIVSRERSFRRAAWIGGLWGIGHSLTVFLVGGAMVVFRIAMPPRIGLALEFGVALMLILLGFNNLRPAAAARGHSHDLPPAFNGVRPLAIGVVHGLAGSVAVALLVLGTVHDPRWGIVYLAVSGGGTIAGMLLVTTARALPIAFSATRFERLHGVFGFGSAMLSVGFGAVLAYQIGGAGTLLREPAVDAAVIRRALHESATSAFTSTSSSFFISFSNLSAMYSPEAMWEMT